MTSKPRTPAEAEWHRRGYNAGRQAEKRRVARLAASATDEGLYPGPNHCPGCDGMVDVGVYGQRQDCPGVTLAASATDEGPRLDTPEQTHSVEYNRGWADGNASALDACNPVIERLQTELAARPAAPVALDVERAADWLMDNLPAVHRWMMVGWRETMRDEAIVLMRQLGEYAALSEPSDD